MQTANRFNGLPQSDETVETVHFIARSAITPLKQGVNETRIFPERPRMKYAG